MGQEPFYVSIIVPVYNEAGLIGSCIGSLRRIDFPRERFEIVVVDDGSTDLTASVVAAYSDVRLIRFTHNRGRIEARKAGAEAARFGNLLFIDARCLVLPDILRVIEGVHYQPLIAGFAGALDGTRYNPYEQVIDLFRERYYLPAAHQREYWITEENFVRSPKGTTCLFIERELFLACQPRERDRHVNDDVKILREVVRRKPLLRHRDVRIGYEARSSLPEVVRHVFLRGPRFQEHYLCRGGAYYRCFCTAVVAGVLMSVLALVYPAIVFYYIGAAVLALIGVSLWLAHTPREGIAVFFYFPVIACSFIAGILYGKLRQFIKRKRIAV